MPDSLRKMTTADLEDVLTWRNHPDVRRYMYTQETIAWDEHQAWFAKAQQDPNRYLMIYERDHKPQGFINISKQSVHHAEWGFYLAPSAPKGSGQRLGRQALNYVFEYLNCHKLWGEVLSVNSRSIRFHERLGFQHEATLRDHFFDGTRYHDVLGFGLLSDEWLSQLESGI